MEPINGLGPTGPVTQVSARARARDIGFRVADDKAARPSGAAGEAEEVAEASLAGLLALQEELDGGPVRDRAARRRGRDLLAELASLQRDLLAGGPDAARLARLADLADTVPEAADPRLRDAVNAIALRARVEAVRYGGG
jgi:hypothetical protein